MWFKFCAVVFLALSLCVSSYGEAKGEIVGVILTGDTPFYRNINKAFVSELSKAGLAGKSVEVLTQTPAPNEMAWVNAARKLVAVGADVIVTYGAPATLAALKETSDIPVVYAGVYKPEALGVLKRNSTGISSTIPVAGVIKNLKGISDFRTLGVVLNSAEKDTVLQAEEIGKVEGQFGFKSVQFNVRRFGDAAKISDVDAIFVTTSCSAQQCMDDIAGVARKLKLPTATIAGGGEESGIIITVSVMAEEQGAVAAEYAARILKGEKPAQIPVGQPKKIEMVINLKEASQLGIKVPIDILTAATRIIK